MISPTFKTKILFPNRIARQIRLKKINHNVNKLNVQEMQKCNYNTELRPHLEQISSNQSKINYKIKSYYQFYLPFKVHNQCIEKRV